MPADIAPGERDMRSSNRWASISSGMSGSLGCDLVRRPDEPIFGWTAGCCSARARESKVGTLDMLIPLSDEDGGGDKLSSLNPSPSGPRPNELPIPPLPPLEAEILRRFSA